MKNRKNSKVRLSDSSSSIVAIDEISKQFDLTSREEYIKKLEGHNVGLSQTVDTLMKQLEQKNQEIHHLQDMLSKMTPVIGEATPIIPTDEEIIAEFQLKALKSAAMSRDLTLDEVKRYDLLVKNKRLAQGNATTIDGAVKKLPKNISNAELIQIASNKTKEE